MKTRLTLLFIFIICRAFAGAGDTTHVVPHDKTFLTWYGDFNKWGVFPDTSKTWRKITLLYTLKCPTSNCTDYDYTQQIFVRRKGSDSLPSLDVEIARLINPFGGGINQSWSRTYRIDVTDYASLFTDSVEIGCHFEGYPQNNQGWLLTLDFEMIEGIPPRPAFKVGNAWNGYFPYGKYVASLGGDTIEAHLNPKSITIEPAAEATVLRVVPTGHGGGGSQNCAEFCPKNYYLQLDNNQIGTRLIWRDDCGLNPTYPGTGAQAQGTWLYDRANWCPGETVTRYDHDLSSYVTPGSTHTIDLDMDQGVSGNYTGYHYQTQLISYGDTSFNLDAAVEDVIAPSKFSDYLRINPTCGQPKIVIRNTGSASLTSLKIDYGVKGAAAQQQMTWTGNLGFLDTAQVTLGSVDWKTPAALKYFTATVSNPNGGADQYPLNNSMEVRFDTVKIYDEKFVVSILTNHAPENYYEITDMSGNILYANILYVTDDVYNDTVDLPAGCYKFVLYDDGKDGLSYPFYGTSGSARFKKLNKPSFWVSFNANFGTSITHYFRTMAMPVGVENSQEEPAFELYPNPASTYAVLNGLDENHPARLSIYSFSGQLILSELIGHPGSAYTVALSTVPPGAYLFELEQGEQVSRRKLVIIR